MNEMQDKELDDLFRKSLTQPEIPFESEAWKAMEAKLDADDKRVFYYRWIAASMVGILLLGGSLWFVRSSFYDTQPASVVQHTVKQEQTAGLHNTVQQKEIVAVESNPLENNTTAFSVQEVKGNTAVVQSPKDHKVIDVKEGKNSSTTFSSSDKISEQAHPSNHQINARHEKIKQERILAIQQHAYKKAMPISSFESLTTAAREAAMYLSWDKAVHEKQQDSLLASFIKRRTTYKSITIYNKWLGKFLAKCSRHNKKTEMPITLSDVTATNDNIIEREQAPIVPDGTVNKIAAQEINETKVNLNTTDTNTSTTTISFPQADEALVLSMDSTVIPDSTVHVPATDVKELLTRSAFKRGFSLSFVVNPEFSSTTDFSFYKPGFNFGLYAEYYLSPRFSILAGVLYSKKVYTCSPYDYASAPSYNYWGQNYTADAVNAYCAVLDIPVNVRYKFLSRKSYNLYAAAGLSSYIMLKENYNFEYQMPYGTKDYAYEIDNKNRYFFNVGNLSLGIEKYISNHWSVQAEPYVKMPFGGVGAGKIKLVSTGMYFSVKYYFR
ncbi:MAG: hypothetical protein JWO58_2326 [Chitinophagaceae bacterium]|nr:hypothetical protein [Chitinophagaceae bacterium]